MGVIKKTASRKKNNLNVPTNKQLEKSTKKHNLEKSLSTFYGGGFNVSLLTSIISNWGRPPPRKPIKANVDPA